MLLELPLSGLTQSPNKKVAFSLSYDYRENENFLEISMQSFRPIFLEIKKLGPFLVITIFHDSSLVKSF